MVFKGIFSGGFYPDTYIYIHISIYIYIYILLIEVLWVSALVKLFQLYGSGIASSYCYLDSIFLIKFAFLKV